MTKLIEYEKSYKKTIISMIAEFFAEHLNISRHESVDIDLERLNEAEEDLQNWINKDGKLFIVDDGEKEAGFIFLAKRGGDVVWIEDLYIKKELRRRGIATRAIKLAERYAHDTMKAEAINLDVVPQNKEAIRLYHSLGYDTIPIFTLCKRISSSGHINKKQNTPVSFLGYDFYV